MGVLNAILAVFTSVIDWFAGSFEALIPVFYTTSSTGGELTFIGVLTVISLAIAVCLLIFRYIIEFLKLRA